MFWEGVRRVSTWKVRSGRGMTSPGPFGPKPQALENPESFTRGAARTPGTLNNTTWTPKVCRIKAFCAIVGGFGLLFYIVLGSRYTYPLSAKNKKGHAHDHGEEEFEAQTWFWV